MPNAQEALARGDAWSIRCPFPLIRRRGPTGSGVSVCIWTGDDGTTHGGASAPGRTGRETGPPGGIAAEEGRRAGWMKARFWEDAGANLLERNPAHFHALRAIVEGCPEEAGLRHRRDLQRWYFLSEDGSPNPKAKAILTAALRRRARTGRPSSSP